MGGWQAQRFEVCRLHLTSSLPRGVKAFPSHPFRDPRNTLRVPRSDRPFPCYLDLRTRSSNSESWRESTDELRTASQRPFPQCNTLSNILSAHPAYWWPLPAFRVPSQFSRVLHSAAGPFMSALLRLSRNFCEYVRPLGPLNSYLSGTFSRNLRYLNLLRHSNRTGAFPLTPSHSRTVHYPPTRAVFPPCTTLVVFCEIRSQGPVP